MFSLNLKLIGQIYSIFSYKITCLVMLLTILLTIKTNTVHNQSLKKCKSRKFNFFLINKRVTKNLDKILKYYKSTI